MDSAVGAQLCVLVAASYLGVLSSVTPSLDTCARNQIPFLKISGGALRYSD